MERFVIGIVRFIAWTAFVIGLLALLLFIAWGIPSAPALLAFIGCTLIAFMWALLLAVAAIAGSLQAIRYQLEHPEQSETEQQS